MVRMRSMLGVASLLAATAFSTPSLAGGFFDRDPVVDLPYRSAYLDWAAKEDLGGRAAPVGIANRPCYLYEGSRLVVLPCPGAEIGVEGGDWVSARY